MLAVTQIPVRRRTLGRWQIARKLEIELEFARQRREIADLRVQVAQVVAGKAEEVAGLLALTASHGRCQRCHRWTTVTVGIEGRWACQTCTGARR